MFPQLQLKLADFDFAKCHDSNASSGTSMFIAPEILDPGIRKSFVESDVYSLGVTALQIFGRVKDPSSIMGVTDDVSTRLNKVIRALPSEAVTEMMLETVA